MFEHVYTNPTAKGEEVKADRMIRELFAYYQQHLEALPPRYRAMITELGEPADRVLCDYISGMTDQYSMDKFRDLFIPKAWEVY